ncbi:MAG: hypothetical protein ACRCT1_23190 [Microcoleaceae cyanobacterium]
MFVIAEGRRKKEEGRRKKGKGKGEEGRDRVLAPNTHKSAEICAFEN